MAAITLQIVVGVIGLVALWLKEYYAGKDRAYDKAQDLRNAVVNGNTGAVSGFVDRLLVGSNSNTAGSQSDADTARRLGTILGEGVVSK